MLSTQEVEDIARQNGVIGGFEYFTRRGVSLGRKIKMFHSEVYCSNNITKRADFFEMDVSIKNLRSTTCIS